MTAVLVDANVLLDVMTQDGHWFAWSSAAIERAADRYRLVVNPIIYAEVSIQYSRIEEFAARYHIPLGALRDWEQGRFEPDAAARAYLAVIAKESEVVRRALAGGSPE